MGDYIIKLLRMVMPKLDKMQSIEIQKEWLMAEGYDELGHPWKIVYRISPIGAGFGLLREGENKGFFALWSQGFRS
jgi:hypothetical protein